LHSLTKYNAKYSWADGDKALVDFAHHLEDSYKNAIIFRVEGDDFLILSEKRLEDADEKIKSYKLFQDSLVSCSVEEKYIEDINQLIAKH